MARITAPPTAVEQTAFFRESSKTHGFKPRSTRFRNLVQANKGQLAVGWHRSGPIGMAAQGLMRFIFEVSMRTIPKAIP